MCPGSPIDALVSHSGIYVLLIDTFEMLTPLEAWITEVFLPQMYSSVSLAVSLPQLPGTLTLADREMCSETVS